MVSHDGSHELLGLLHDISDRKAEQARLSGLANEDDLTGLPNRRVFLDALQRALARADRHDHPFALLYLDLDGFKAINDYQGHATGDRALCTFAARVRGCLRRADVLARLGGDEFAILADGLCSDAAMYREKVRRRGLAAA